MRKLEHLNRQGMVFPQLLGACLCIVGGAGTALFGLMLVTTVTGTINAMQDYLGVVVFLLALTLWMLCGGMKLLRRCTRAARYAYVMDLHPAWTLPEMAEAAHVKEDKARQEIKELFRKGWLRGGQAAAAPQAQTVVTAAPGTVRVEICRPAAQPSPAEVKQVLAKCPACGATARVPADGTAVCAYCGRPLL